MFAEIELKLENLHNFYNCKDKSCREFSEGEKARQKLLKKTRMHHKWLKGKDLVYCKNHRDLVVAVLRKLSWLAAKPHCKCPSKISKTVPPPLASSGSTEWNNWVSSPVACTLTSSTITTGTPSLADKEVEETSKALELPDLDAEDSDYGSDFGFS